MSGRGLRNESLFAVIATFGRNLAFGEPHRGGNNGTDNAFGDNAGNGAAEGAGGYKHAGTRILASANSYDRHGAAGHGGFRAYCGRCQNRIADARIGCNGNGTQRVLLINSHLRSGPIKD